MPSGNLYDMVRLADLGGIGSVRYDWLLLGGGSDARAYEVLQTASTKDIFFSRVMLFDFDERRTDVDPTVQRAYRRYERLHADITLIGCSLRDPSASLKSVASHGIEFKKAARLAVDISCFTRPYFFALLKYLQQHCQVTGVDVFYTEPASYVLPRGLLRSYRASLGPLFVMEVPGFPGHATGRRKSILVVTMGFDGDLSAFISEEVTPDCVIVVNGFPAYSPKFKDISLINNERLLNASDARERLAFCRANNPYDLFNLLAGVRRSHPEAFLNIAPLGPKPMALGACMFALADSSVRVVYPMPEKYANVSTDACWQSWRYVVPFTVAPQHRR